jgi:hypothetical protein
MANSKFKLRRILELICDSLSQTRRYLLIHQYVSKMNAAYPDLITPNFFSIVSEATLREAILGITRLMDNDQESINFKLLLDMVENHPRILHNPVEDKTLVEINRRRLVGQDELLKSLRPIRDRELAHLDRKHINDPNAVAAIPIPIKDLYHCTEVLSEILADIWQAFHGTPFPGYEEEAMILRELESLRMTINNCLGKAENDD